MTPDGRVELISKIISDILNIDCAVMMGATLAHEVAEEQFSEATIGAVNDKTYRKLRLTYLLGFNPIALRKAKVAYNFGLFECNRVKSDVSEWPQIFKSVL